ncbi:hypothetical protein Cni_G27799 [Canna indica]|uniref:Uncharacterized protein n=1 Tax=Canna indica TaxID=4628 RepID=A0AAQ3L1F1_9LILI|nr:hypothetical protein Cni_G27799 [Canna indica]
MSKVQGFSSSSSSAYCSPSCLSFGLCSSRGVDEQLRGGGRVPSAVHGDAVAGTGAPSADLEVFDRGSSRAAGAYRSHPEELRRLDRTILSPIA